MYVFSYRDYSNKTAGENQPSALARAENVAHKTATDQAVVGRTKDKLCSRVGGRALGQPGYLHCCKRSISRVTSSIRTRRRWGSVNKFPHNSNLCRFYVQEIAAQQGRNWSIAIWLPLQFLGCGAHPQIIPLTPRHWTLESTEWSLHQRNTGGPNSIFNILRFTEVHTSACVELPRTGYV